MSLAWAMSKVPFVSLARVQLLHTKQHLPGDQAALYLLINVFDVFDSYHGVTTCPTRLAM